MTSLQKRLGKMEIKNQKKLELIWVQSPEALFQFWPTITQGMIDVFAERPESMDETTMLNDILAQHMTVWMGFLDHEYIGFATLKIWTEPKAPDRKIMFMNHVYKRPEIKDNLRNEFMVAVEEQARKMDCVELRFCSLRNMEKYAASLGFFPGFMEYRKPLKGV